MILYALDTSKDEFVGFDGLSLFSLKNGPKEVQEWLNCLAPNSQIALEPTASYGEFLASKAVELGHTVFMIQPAWIKSHRASQGKRAKTDSVDARLIYDYVKSNEKKLHPWRPRTQEIEQLRSLVLQRQALVDDLARMRQRYEALKMDSVLMSQMLDPLKKACQSLNSEIKKRLLSIPESKWLLSIKGVGPGAASHLLIALKSLPFRSPDSLIAWIGIDPVANDSGKQKSPRRISKKGNPYLRRAMYLAAVAASRSNSWKDRYEHLKAKGLAPKQAIIALAKKIAVTAYHLFHKQVLFDANLVALKKTT